MDGAYQYTLNRWYFLAHGSQGTYHSLSTAVDQKSLQPELQR